MRCVLIPARSDERGYGGLGVGESSNYIDKV